LRQLFYFLVLGATLIVAALAWAADLRGTVINGTTRKPAAGDEVVLLTLSQDGMNEIAHAKTDRSGQFRVALPGAQASYLVRAVHQGVTYHKQVEAGLKSVAVEVYDVAEKLDGVTAVMDVERFEATDDHLEVKQLITMRNDSRPPRTLMNDHPFEIQLAPDAEVQSGLVQVEDGQPLKQRPLASDQKGQYYFLFPIRPGDTRFAVIYRLAYTGGALIEPQIRNPLERFVVMVPRSMKFEPRAGGIFRPMPDTTPDNVQGTAPAMPGQTLAFRISGTGRLDELAGRRQEAHQAQRKKGFPADRAGGGLGPPIDAPDPLQQYQWPILVGLGALVVCGAIYVVKKTKLAPGAQRQSANHQMSARPPQQQARIRRNGRHPRRVHAQQKRSH
jgi:5-hydroxyisourate hydrolase-like protein (transthyretin family)